MDDGALGDWDVVEGLGGLVLCGRLCGGGSRFGEGGLGCGGWEVLAWVWVRVGVRAGSILLPSYLLWFLGLCGVVLVMLLVVVVVVLLRAVLLFGSGFGSGLGFGLGSGSRLRRTSSRRCEGTATGWGGLAACCWGAWVGCVGVGGPPAAWRVAEALALAVALWMRSAGRAGSEEEVEDVDENEDEEEVVVSGDVGCAPMGAGAALRAAAASAAPTAGRMEGMSSGRGLGTGGWRGPARIWRPGGPIRPAAVGIEARGCGLRLLGSAGLGSCNA